MVSKVQEIDQGFQQKEQELERKWEEMERVKRETELKIKEEEEAHEQRMQWGKERLMEDRRQFEEMKDRSTTVAQASTQREQLITLDVGGEKFRTDLRTLKRHPDSIFPEAVRIAEAATKSRCEYVFIDRDHRHFRFILNFMRQGEEVMRGTALRNADKYVLHEILCEVRYYKLKRLEQLIQRHIISCDRNPITFSALITEKLFVVTNLKTMSSPKYKTTKQLLLKEENLRGIIFESVLFQHPVSFENCVLEGAKFKHCAFKAAICFIGSDVTRVQFDHCDVTPGYFEMDDAQAAKVTFNPHLPRSQFNQY